MSTCNTLGINPYTPSSSMPWNEARVKHLYRRAAYGANYSTIQQALQMSPSELIDQMVDEAMQVIPNPDPGWGYLDHSGIIREYGSSTIQTIKASREVTRNTYYDSFRNHPVYGRMLMFWINHFVVSDAGDPPYQYQNTLMRQTHTMGNFKDFVRAVGTDPYMLLYLNGYENTNEAPNENYARELYELFTLGVDNGYTEKDIEETAKALTGYNKASSFWGPIVFQQSTFDAGEKTIFGQTGNWGHDDVIDILFEQKATLIADFICTKMYRFFISEEVNQDIVDALATTFIQNNFEIAPVVRQLLKSEHFFDDSSIGVMIKSPIDLAIIMQNELDMLDTLALNNWANTISTQAGMNIIIPPNVAGWPGGDVWLNSITIPKRWDQTAIVLRNLNNSNTGAFEKLVTDMFSNVNEPVENVVKTIVNFFLTRELHFDYEYDDAIVVFKEGVPAVYFEDGTWDLTYPELGEQVYNLINYYVLTLPEFQLK